MIGTKKAFSLIELLIATAIAGILSAALFSIVWQVNKGVASLDWTVDVHFKGMIIQRTLERDLAGVCVPNSFFAYHEQRKKQNEQKTESAVGKKAGISTKEIPRIEKVFYAKAQNNELLMTFLTTNPLPVYFDETVDKPAQRLVRVTYRLKANEGAQKKNYTLWREESDTIAGSEISSTNSARSYTVADDIKEFKITFHSYEQKEVQEGQKAPEPVKRSEKVTEWDHENVAIKDGKPDQILVPQLVTFTVVLAQAKGTRTYQYEFAVACVADSCPLPQIERTDKAEQKQKVPAVNARPQPMMMNPAPKNTPQPPGQLPGMQRQEAPMKKDPKNIPQSQRSASLQSLFGFPFSRR